MLVAASQAAVDLLCPSMYHVFVLFWRLIQHFKFVVGPFLISAGVPEFLWPPVGSPATQQLQICYDWKTPKCCNNGMHHSFLNDLQCQ